jgi:cbb3-type cytochrome oxidase subunit 3
MGFAVNIALLAFGIFFYGFMTLYLNHVNKRRREGKEDYKIAGLTDTEIEVLGDRSPRFMYMI